MLRPPARLQSGEIFFDGKDISLLDGEDLRRQRRGGFALVLQSGMNALNPVRTIAHHFGDILKAHKIEGEHWNRAAIAVAGARCSTKCARAGRARPLSARTLRYRQRVSIALAWPLSLG
jgi:ABC-type glutathione transport system ATPase component